MDETSCRGMQQVLKAVRHSPGQPPARSHSSRPPFAGQSMPLQQWRQQQAQASSLHAPCSTQTLGHQRPDGGEQQRKAQLQKLHRMANALKREDTASSCLKHDQQPAQPRTPGQPSAPGKRQTLRVPQAAAQPACPDWRASPKLARHHQPPGKTCARTDFDRDDCDQTAQPRQHTGRALPLPASAHPYPIERVYSQPLGHSHDRQASSPQQHRAQLDVYPAPSHTHLKETDPRDEEQAGSRWAWHSRPSNLHPHAQVTRVFLPAGLVAHMPTLQCHDEVVQVASHAPGCSRAYLGHPQPQLFTRPAPYCRAAALKARSLAARQQQGYGLHREIGRFEECADAQLMDEEGAGADYDELYDYHPTSRSHGFMATRSSSAALGLTAVCGVRPPSHAGATGMLAGGVHMYTHEAAAESDLLYSHPACEAAQRAHVPAAVYGPNADMAMGVHPRANWSTDTAVQEQADADTEHPGHCSWRGAHHGYAISAHCSQQQQLPPQRAAVRCQAPGAEQGQQVRGSYLAAGQGVRLHSRAPARAWHAARDMPPDELCAFEADPGMAVHGEHQQQHVLSGAGECVRRRDPNAYATYSDGGAAHPLGHGNVHTFSKHPRQQDAVPQAMSSNHAGHFRSVERPDTSPQHPPGAWNQMQPQEFQAAGTICEEQPVVHDGLKGANVAGQVRDAAHPRVTPSEQQPARRCAPGDKRTWIEPAPVCQPEQQQQQQQSGAVGLGSRVPQQLPTSPVSASADEAQPSKRTKHTASCGRDKCEPGSPITSGGTTCTANEGLAGNVPSAAPKHIAAGGSSGQGVKSSTQDARCNPASALDPDGSCRAAAAATATPGTALMQPASQPSSALGMQPDVRGLSAPTSQPGQAYVGSRLGPQVSTPSSGLPLPSTDQGEAGDTLLTPAHHTPSMMPTTPAQRPANKLTSAGTDPAGSGAPEACQASGHQAGAQLEAHTSTAPADLLNLSQLPQLVALLSPSGSSQPAQAGITEAALSALAQQPSSLSPMVAQQLVALASKLPASAVSSLPKPLLHLMLAAIQAHHATKTAATSAADVPLATGAPWPAQHSQTASGWVTDVSAIQSVAVPRDFLVMWRSAEQLHQLAPGFLVRALAPGCWDALLSAHSDHQDQQMDVQVWYECGRIEAVVPHTPGAGAASTTACLLVRFNTSDTGLRQIRLEEVSNEVPSAEEVQCWLKEGGRLSLPEIRHLKATLPAPSLE